jgi:hypothetical protein
MTIYVVEVKGRGIAAYHADNGAAAEVRVRDRVFRDDLRPTKAVKSGGDDESNSREHCHPALG